MKNSILVAGLFSMVMVLTSFTTNEERVDVDKKTSLSEKSMAISTLFESQKKMDNKLVASINFESELDSEIGNTGGVNPGTPLKRPD